MISDGCGAKSGMDGFGMGSNKKLEKSGQENVKNSRVVIFGVILPFYKGQHGSKFSQNRSGQAGSGQPERFLRVFFLTPSLMKFN